jgi:hypothetical protein
MMTQPTALDLELVRTYAEEAVELAGVRGSAATRAIDFTVTLVGGTWVRNSFGAIAARDSLMLRNIVRRIVWHAERGRAESEQRVRRGELPKPESARLPDPADHLLALCLVHGMSVREAAVALDLTVEHATARFTAMHDELLNAIRNPPTRKAQT